MLNSEYWFSHSRLYLKIRMILIIVYIVIGMKPVRLVALIVFVSSLIGACSHTSDTKTIVTAFYPLEFITKEIVRNDFRVVNVTPVGAEPHELELSPSATQTILGARAAILMGDGFQPNVENTARSRTGNTTYVLEKITKKKSRKDPHFWLDPVSMKKAVSIISQELIKINPSQKKIYEARTNDFEQKLDDLDDSFAKSFATCFTRTFITSHEAFGWLAERYDLHQEAIAGLSPENEPTAKRLLQLKKLAQQKHVSVIFTEDFVSPKVTQSLSREIGVTTKVLSPIESLSQKDIDHQHNYFTIMKDDLALLRDALGCK
jgi:zinc transport system substrate-binding protein